MDVISLPQVKYITVNEILNLIVEKLAPIETVLNIKKSFYNNEKIYVTERLSEADYNLIMEIFYELKLIPDFQSENEENEKNNFKVKDIKKYALEHLKIPAKVRGEDKKSEIVVDDCTEQYIATLQKYILFLKFLHEIKKESWNIFQHAFDNSVNKPSWNLYVEFDSSREKNIRIGHLDMINVRIKAGDIKILNENRIFVNEASLDTKMKLEEAKYYLATIGFDSVKREINAIDGQENKLVTEIRELADEIGLERWRAGIREITARNICDAVAKRLGNNTSHWGRKGPRLGSNVRKIGLKGWRFTPPPEE